MKICPEMDLSELAERMGQIATVEEARYMRLVLCETNPDDDTADMPDHVWQRAIRSALTLKAADDLEERTGQTLDEMTDTYLLRWLRQDWPHLDAERCLSDFLDQGFDRVEIYDALECGLTCARTLRAVLRVTGQTLDDLLAQAEGGAE